jgi:RNA polymerase sigma factor (TIGR02999 family)
MRFALISSVPYKTRRVRGPAKLINFSRGSLPAIANLEGANAKSVVDYAVVSVPEESVSALMNAFRTGNAQAGAMLTEMFYPELKRLAARHLSKEHNAHSWQPTLLVNELYLELSKIKGLNNSDRTYDDDKAAFFALAGLLMKRLLVHHARPLEKRILKVPLWEDLRSDPEAGLAEIDSLLRRLESIDPVLRTVVELKVFEGLTAEEIARRMGWSVIAVNRNWQFARQWLQTKV